MAEWTDYKTNPMVHLLPYWDFNIGQKIDVRAFSNAPKVELFFNGKSLGAQTIDHKKGTHLACDWQIAFEPGELKAVAYDENDTVIAEAVQKSFGDAKKIVCKPDKEQLLANGEDL